jgi:type VI secretion system lysozyme-like protein
MQYTDPGKESLHARLLGHDSPAAGIKNYVNCIKRDLEIMLNTTAYGGVISTSYKALSHSALSFGMPDFIEMPYEKEGDYSYLIQLIENLIEHFEKRLSHVQVDVLNEHMGHDLMVHLRISANVNYGVSKEAIEFESTLDPITRSMRVL